MYCMLVMMEPLAGPVVLETLLGLGLGQGKGYGLVVQVLLE